MIDGVKVKFKRGTKQELEAMPVVDGQLLWDIETGETFEDVGDKRVPTGGDINGGQTVAPAIPITESGEIISTDIVSPLEHEVKCRIYSTNNFDISKVKNSGKITSDGKALTVTGSGYALSGATLAETCPYLREGDTFIVSADTTARDKYCYITAANQLIYFERPYTVTSKMLSGQLAWYAMPDSSAATISNIRITKGDTAAPWSDFVPVDTVVVTQNPGGKTFRPSSDGTVSGMTSLSPSMTILTDTSGVTIEATYNADTKGYIDREINKKVAAQVAAYTGGVNNE